jgi:fatty-acid peroxygenase
VQEVRRFCPFFALVAGRARMAFEWRGHRRECVQPIPQGGGDPYVNQRCAGEWITIEIMKRAVRVRTRQGARATRHTGSAT